MGAVAQLTQEVALEGFVRKGEYVYYSIEVPPGRALEVTIVSSK